MDLFFLIITIIQVLIGGIISIFLTKLSRKTRYIPTVLLGAFFAVFATAFALTIPLFWIPESQELVARGFQNTSVILLFLMFPFLVMAFEGMKGRFFSPITTLFVAFTAFCMGFLAVVPPRWNYEFIDGWWVQTTTLEFDILFILYGLSAMIIVLVRLIQFIREEGSGRSKKMPIIALIGILAAVGGGFGLYLIGIPNIDYLSVLIGTAIMAIIYIKDPNSFFLSNTRISAIMLINTTNKIPYLTIGERKGKPFLLAAAGLGGVMMLLQEILEAENPPTRLFHGDRGFLLEHDIEHELTAVIVADQVNDVLRRPLRYALSLFITKYEADLTAWTGEVSGFQVFEEDLRRIFKFALPSSEP